MLRRLLIACVVVVVAAGLFAATAASLKPQGAGNGQALAAVPVVEGQFRSTLARLQSSAESWSRSTAELRAIVRRARVLADAPQLAAIRTPMLQLAAAAWTLLSSAREVAATCGSRRVVGCHVALEQALQETVYAERSLARFGEARKVYLD